MKQTEIKRLQDGLLSVEGVCGVVIPLASEFPKKKFSFGEKCYKDELGEMRLKKVRIKSHVTVVIENMGRGKKIETINKIKKVIGIFTPALLFKVRVKKVKVKNK